jgi:outer membrane receptor protein involved in Fe transport
MRKSNLRATAAWQALALLGAGALATPAFAQDTTAPASSETAPASEEQPTIAPEAQQDSDDAIVVTGSRLVRPELDAPSPVTTVDSETFDLTGTVTVETLLNELPQLIPGNTRTSNNQGGEDFSTLDLRGLGPQRTLILVDGERVPATSTSGVVDIGTIPAGLIERVDVVTGGASAVYGSDAMAGVVNFILKDNYEGMEVTAQYGITEHGDGGTFNIQGLLGGNFGDDRGNLTFFTSYYTREGIGQGDRDITRDAGVVCYDYEYDLSIPRTDRRIRYFTPDHFLQPCPDVRESSFGSVGFIGDVDAGSGTPPWGWIAQNSVNRFGGAGRPTGLSTVVTTGPGGTTNNNFDAGFTDTNCDGITGNAVNSGNISFDENGLLEPRNTSGLCGYADRSTGSSRYNFNPVNYLVTPYNRWNMALTGRYDISDAIRLKIVANYNDSNQQVSLAPTPVTGLVIDPTLNPFIVANGACGVQSCHPDLLAALQNRSFFTRPDALSPDTPSGFREFGALNPETQLLLGDATPEEILANQLAACSQADVDGDGDADPTAGCVLVSGADRPFTMDRRWSEAGPRIGDTGVKTATLRGTLSGPLAHGFNWDATLSYGRTDANQVLAGNTNRTATLQGLAGCTDIVTLPGCIPVDIFGQNTMTPEMVAFTTITTKESRSFDQARIAGNITGNLLELPAGPVGIAIGAEARTDRGSIRVDDAQRTGNIYGFNATQDQKGKLNVKELYGEVRVPILADLPFVHEFSVEAGARFSDYSSVGGLFNWKLGAQWSPVDWLKFRGVFNKAARAPSIVELFQGGDQGFPSYVDFCNSAGRTVDELAICTAQAPLADFSGFQQNNAQVEAFSFGNPGLSEESANTFTIGAVLTPNLGLGRFSATVDYYNIDIKDLIIALGAQTFLNRCAASGDPNSSECLRIERDPSTGQVERIDTTVSNEGRLKTSGVDVGLNYAVPFSDIGLGIGGRLRVQELLSWLDKWEFSGTEFAGTTGGGIGGTLPEWKSTLTVAYDSDDFTVQGRWNWQSDVIDTWGGTCPDGSCVLDSKTPGLSYFDLSMRKSIGNNFELTGIVQNLFNQKARKTLSGFFAEGGVDVAYWNPVILGRTFTVQGKVKF